jgi:hypothetical protein
MLHVPLVCALGLVVATQALTTPKETAPIVGDVSGEWSGDVKTPVSHSPIPMYFSLRQDRGEVSGTAGPGPASQFPISEVTRSGRALHFAVSGEGVKYIFDLTVAGDVLEGRATCEEQSHASTGRAALHRAQPSPR